MDLVIFFALWLACGHMTANAVEIAAGERLTPYGRGSFLVWGMISPWLYFLEGLWPAIFPATDPGVPTGYRVWYDEFSGFVRVLPELRTRP